MTCIVEASRLRSTSALDLVLADWLHHGAHWTLAVTYTLRRRDERGKPINERILKSAATHFLTVLNVACFGQRRAKRGHTVGSAVSFGWGSYGDHPHLHFSLAAPTDMGLDAFSALVEEAARRTYWIQSQKGIKPDRDSGWIHYMVDHGTDNLIVELVRLPSPA